MWNARLHELQAGIKITAINIKNIRYSDDTSLTAESEEELKSLLMMVKEESEKAGLQLNIQKTKIMASGPITSWQIYGETMETVMDFVFLGSKISGRWWLHHEIKRCFLLGRKAMTNLNSILKNRDITLLTKVCLVKAMVFSSNPCIDVGEGSGTPLQYSCLENLMDGGAWWAAVHGVAKSDITEQLHFHFSLSCIGEGNGNPLQFSCPENPRDGGAWWAAVYGVA